MILKHRYLFPTSILLSSVAGFGSSLAINTKEKLEVENQIIDQEALENKQGKEPNAEEETTENEADKKSQKLNGTLANEEIAKIDVKENLFLQKTEKLISKDGIKEFNEEQQRNAQSKFDEYQKKNYTEETWKLLDYNNPQNWRYKAIDLISINTQTSKDLLNTIGKEINTSEEEGKEELTSKLRSICYEVAGNISREGEFKEKFSSENAEYDEEEIMSFCAFVVSKE